MPVFFIDEAQVQGRTVRITGPLLRHLHGSLRIEAGEELIFVVPGRRRYRVRVNHVDSSTLVGLIVEEETSTALPYPPVTLAQALLKGERMDWLIQKATELGVANIVPLVAQRSIVRPRTDRVQIQQERWQRIAVEAAQQAERWDSPPITAPLDADRFFADRPPTDMRLMLCEHTGGQSLAALHLPIGDVGNLVIAVGPEGGWRPEELDHAVRRGFVAVTLGPRILRAETAALAALTILQSRLGQLG